MDGWSNAAMGKDTGQEDKRSWFMWIFVILSLMPLTLTTSSCPRETAASEAKRSPRRERMGAGASWITWIPAFLKRVDGECLVHADAGTRWRWIELIKMMVKWITTRSPHHSLISLYTRHRSHLKKFLTSKPTRHTWCLVPFDIHR